MKNSSLYLENLINQLSMLPGIGRKSASRLAFYFLQTSENNIDYLIDAIVSLKKNISTCKICGGISDNEICNICSDETRDKKTICVVEDARDMLTIEKTGEFQGIYHILMGLISPLDGIGPENLNINKLLQRCKNENITEVILALNPTIEGDATSLYMASIFSNEGIKLTRIAQGLSAGSDLEFADSATIAKSLDGRVEII